MRNVEELSIYTLNKIMSNIIHIPIFDRSLMMLGSSDILIQEDNKIKRLNLGSIEMVKICRTLVENESKLNSVITLKSLPLEHVMKQYKVIESDRTHLAYRLLYKQIQLEFGPITLLPIKDLKERLGI